MGSRSSIKFLVFGRIKELSAHDFRAGICAGRIEEDVPAEGTTLRTRSNRTHTHKKTGKLKRKDKMSLFYYLTVFSILLNPTTRTMRNCDSSPNYNRLINCDSSPIYYNQLINDASNRLLRLFDQIQSHGQRLYRLLLSLPSTTHIRAKKRLQFVVRLKNKGSYLNFEITGREKKRCTRYITFCPSNNHHHFEQYSRFNYMLSTVR